MAAQQQIDALGAVRIRSVPTGWPAVLGWRYLDGYSPAEVAAMHDTTPRTVLLAAQSLGCVRLYLLGCRWTDADGKPSPRWDPKRPWGEQWDMAQAVLADDKARRKQLREAAAMPKARALADEAVA